MKFPGAVAAHVGYTIVVLRLTGTGCPTALAEWIPAGSHVNDNARR